MGEATGTGTKTYKDGSIYEGLFIKGKPNGKGTKLGGNWQKVDNSTFTSTEILSKSEFKRMKSIITVESSSSNDKAEAYQYHGNWKDEMFHGEGVLTFANGDKYIGVFKYGKPFGKGLRVSNGYFLTIFMSLETKKRVIG